MKLTDSYDVMSDTFEYRGIEVAVDLSYDVVLKVLELLSSDLDDLFKVTQTLDLLVPFLDTGEMGFEERFELFEYLLENFLSDESSASEHTDDYGDDSPQEKVMDFDKDAELIYASFFHAYKIDLFNSCGKLHWRRFQALLTNLPEDTVLKQVIGYRVMEVPKKGEASDDYIKHVKRMKRLYSLDSQEDIQLTNDDKLSALAAKFGGDAVG